VPISIHSLFLTFRVFRSTTLQTRVFLTQFAASWQLLCRLARTFHHKDAKAPRLKWYEPDGLMVRVFAPSRLCGVIFLVAAMPRRVFRVFRGLERDHFFFSKE
jgi:hypothetical protein